MAVVLFYLVITPACKPPWPVLLFGCCGLQACRSQRPDADGDSARWHLMHVQQQDTRQRRLSRSVCSESNICLTARTHATPQLNQKPVVTVTGCNSAYTAVRGGMHVYLS
jgi:hypothetical protein